MKKKILFLFAALTLLAPSLTFGDESPTTISAEQQLKNCEAADKICKTSWSGHPSDSSGRANQAGGCIFRDGEDKYTIPFGVWSVSADGKKVNKTVS